MSTSSAALTAVTSRPVPVVSAPLAGGPSTWQLAAAVSAAGGLGLLAGGMRPIPQLIEDVASLRQATHAPFGVNLFVPEPANTAIPTERSTPGSEARRRRATDVATYRSSLLAEAARLGLDPADLPAADTLDPDALGGWDSALDAAEAGHWPLITFTFGLPSPEVFDRLHASGSALGVTVTSAQEAVLAMAHGADLLCVQGPESGGHRSVHDPAAEPGTTALVDLVAEVRAAVGNGPGSGIALFAAGGIMDADGVRTVLRAGADAAQCGTVFLRAEEAGTSALQRAALERAAEGTDFVNPDGGADTALTRAFSGRWARGLRNRFMGEHADAPAAYPEVNELTKPLRAAATAAGDAGGTSLWAGVGAARTRALPAAEILETLAP